jgi:tripartite-type tricarboxylate transporter receptor subunit TctC
MTRWMFACACAASALVLGLAPPASAAWPDRPIRLVLPFPAGGPTDTLGRQLAQQLQTALGQGVVVDNRAGANSAIGSDIVAKSSADGYTLLFNASLFASNPHLMTLPYDIHRDFTPIALIAKAPLLIAVNRDLPVKDVRDLIAYARSNPGKLNFGIGSNGSAGHLAQESLRSSAGIDIVMVPYKGSSPAYVDLIGGRLQGFTDPVLGALPQVHGGTVRALAVTSARRLSVLPDVPTVAESGVMDYRMVGTFGMFLPAGTSQAIVAKLNADMNAMLARPEYRERLTSQGAEVPGPGSPADLAAMLKSELVTWAKVVKQSGVRVE